MGSVKIHKPLHNTQFTNTCTQVSTTARGRPTEPDPRTKAGGSAPAPAPLANLRWARGGSIMQVECNAKVLKGEQA